MQGKREIKTEPVKRRWLLPVCIIGALAAVYTGFCAAAARETIAPRVTVGSADIGGMTRAEAARSIGSALASIRAESGVYITLEDGTEAAFLSYDGLGAGFDADTLADKAYALSHSGNAAADGWVLLRACLGYRTELRPEPVAGWTDAAAEKLADAGELPALDFSHEIVNDSILRLTKARDGRVVDRPALKALLDKSLPDASGSRAVALPYAVAAADPGDLYALSDRLGGEMANASYDTETGAIIPERPSLHFDVARAQALLDAAAPGDTVSVPAEVSAPAITAAELERVLFRDVLGTYTTRVSGSAGRKANVKLTAERVNGFVMNNGEEFNYYTLTGPFTGANGYQPAPGYLHGKTVQMDGGGACQCSSTIYAAALLANLEIVARTAHGFASDYIGLGLDATVSGGGPEFIFRNNTPYPIKVEAVYSANHRLTINILGTKTDDITVKIRTAVLSTTPYEEEVIEDPALAPGERVVDTTPYTGYTVNTYRQLYDGSGALISETLEAFSRYNKRNRIVHVGPAGTDAFGEETPPVEETPSAGAPAENVSETPPSEAPASDMRDRDILP